MKTTPRGKIVLILSALLIAVQAAVTAAGPVPENLPRPDGKPGDATKPVKVYILAGQSNMVGSDSKVKDIKRFPPFAGLENPQRKVKFSYSIGRENKMTSDGWVDLQPVNNVVGPELSVARRVSGKTAAPIAIIKCAAGGTHLGGDWNPDEPIGFRMYPLALERAEKNNCAVGRIRQDCAMKNGLSFWVVGDQILKGAALNAVQIAEAVTKL